MEFEKDQKIVLIIPSHNFNSYEYDTVRRLLEDAGVKVIVASDNPNIAIGEHETESVAVDHALNDIDAADYNGVFFIGGKGTMEHLDNEESYRIARDARDMGLPFGAMDLAVRILAKAGVLRGLQATGLDTDRQLGIIIGEHGGTYRVGHVMLEGMLVTGSTPNDSKEFGEAILKVLYKASIDAPAHIPKRKI